MKKEFLMFLTSFICLTVTNAQFTKLGGGPGYTTGYHFNEMDNDENQSGHFSFFVKGIYELSLPVHISPSITYFIPNVSKVTSLGSESKITVSTMMIDVNGYYVFYSLSRFEFYGLAGLDILQAWKKDVFKTIGTANPVEETTREKDNAIGLNIGAGTYIKLTEQMDLNIEAKYLLSRYNQFMINAGILLNLQWMAGNAKPGK